MEAYFDHEKLDVYQSALGHVAWVHELLGRTQLIVAATDHLGRASESIVRNIVRANSKRTPAERAHFFDVAYGSGLECAACLDVLNAWELISAAHLSEGKAQLDRIVAMLIGIRPGKRTQVRESSPVYGSPADGQPQCFFAHERLRAYQSALRFIRWSAALIQSTTVGLSQGRELDRHGTGIILNIAEGNGKFSVAERRRFLDTAQSAGLQAASSLDILSARSAITREISSQGREHLQEIVSMIAGLSRSLPAGSSRPSPRPVPHS